MTVIDALILGIVEGMTEFLPISSTGHLILTAQLLGLSGEFVKSFEIAIQLGAILAVLVLYGARFLKNPQIQKNVLVAFLPTAVGGLFLYKIVKTVFFESIPLILAALFLGGIALILFEKLYKEKGDTLADLEKMSYRQAFSIGCFQVIAMVPGVSRAAATIIGGLLVGLSRRAVVEFSFLLAAPTMLAATALDLIKSGTAFSAGEHGLLVLGGLTAFISALIAVRWFVSFISSHDFTRFGIYRIALALAWWVAL